MHKVYYQPEGIWVGDIMPYGEDGTFYLYHQRDTRNPEPFGEPFGWALATTKDFVNYKELGLNSETAVMFNITSKEQVIVNTWYGGEMKKVKFMQ